MNARLPSICWASVADAGRAARESRHDAEDTALDEHVKNTYGPPFAADFVLEALQDARLQLAQQIAAASERLGQSLNPEHPQLTSMGNSLDEWLRAYATERGREDLARRRHANH